jgi:hypothetical protein
MSEGRTAATAAHRVGTGAGRLVRAGRDLPPERRLAAYAAVGLFLTLFLPWYQRQFFVFVKGKSVSASDSQTGWAAFSFVEAAVLLVAIGVLVLLFQRAEGRAFHLPGGDGGVIAAAGFWTCVLVIWRIFDKQGSSATGQDVLSYGIEWGIFVALAVAALLAYAGTRIRAAGRPEPPPRAGRPEAVTREPIPPEPVPPATPTPAGERRPPRLLFAEPATEAARAEAEEPGDEAATEVQAPRPPADQPDEQLTIPLDGEDA